VAAHISASWAGVDMVDSVATPYYNYADFFLGAIVPTVNSKIDFETHEALRSLPPAIEIAHSFFAYTFFFFLWLYPTS
jgi:hypothetical protein